jgi:hypothetical protein
MFDNGFEIFCRANPIIVRTKNVDRVILIPAGAAAAHR